MRAYLFPGQGSQQIGMGRGLFDEFKELTQCANEIFGFNIKSLCLEDKEKKLNQTRFTQAAIYVVNALSYFNHLNKTGQNADYFAGHSLGEYNALLSANVFDFATGCHLVKKRAELMHDMQDGGMAAIVGPTLTELQEILKQHALDHLTIANHNTYKQFVISGKNSDLERAKDIFMALSNVTYHPLQVSGAFHSPLMKSPSEKFYSFLKDYQFNMPNQPVLSNVTAKPYHPSMIHKTLSDQISSTVRWREIIEYLLSYKNINLIALGQSQVINGLIARIKNGT